MFLIVRKLRRTILKQSLSCFQHSQSKRTHHITIAKMSSLGVSFDSTSHQDRIEEIRKEFSILETNAEKGTFKLERDNVTGVATLCISNPKHKNCFTANMMAQFSKILDELHNWKEVKYLNLPKIIVIIFDVLY